MYNSFNAKGCSPLPNRAAPETGCVDEMTSREQHANQVIPAFGPVAARSHSLPARTLTCNSSAMLDLILWCFMQFGKRRSSRQDLEASAEEERLKVHPRK